MWLKSFQYNNKTISDVELLVLSCINENAFVEATTLIETLDQNLPHWSPERGTIYPLLHRLTAQGLLQKDKQGKNLRFRRTDTATTFLSSLLSSDSLLAQFDTTTRYLEILARSMMNVNPFAAESFLNKFEERIKRMGQNISNFQEEVSSRIEADDWVEIDIE